MKKIIAIGIIIIMMLPCVAFADKFTITVDSKYISYLQEKADEEKMTIEQLITSAVTGIAKSRIKYEYKNRIYRQKTEDEKISELSISP